MDDFVLLLAKRLLIGQLLATLLFAALVVTVARVIVGTSAQCR